MAGFDGFPQPIAATECSGKIAMKFCVQRACLSGTCEPVYFVVVKAAVVTAFADVSIAAG